MFVGYHQASWCAAVFPGASKNHPASKAALWFGHPYYHCRPKDSEYLGIEGISPHMGIVGIFLSDSNPWQHR